ncbi:HisH Glutamine amidotransferase [Candidatus Methylopumilus universalis]|uniref:imidazole glycerol phosphate synthase subunit HisH n=1 Tax=Candidatus Methylopumilus universalis TaxID=2588536 RepID=UPI003BEF3FD6
MSMPEATIIDYGVGNLLSVQRGLEHCGAKVIVTADSAKILNSSHVVLPGVGAFGNAMEALKRLGLVSVIYELVQRKIPLLGICLGMQLLFEESDEFGVTPGLGLIPGRVIAIPDQTALGVSQKIPHIGWRSFQQSNPLIGWENTLLQDNCPGETAYFVHSFMAMPSDSKNRIADCSYGDHKIAAVICRDQISGCQFHPEKSGETGLKILRRFLL